MIIVNFVDGKAFFNSSLLKSRNHIHERVKDIH